MATAAHPPGITASAVDFNCGPATAAATALLGAARPGARHQRCFSESVAQPTTAAEVAEWVDFMKAQHAVGAIVSLLSPEEAATYEAPGVEAAMRSAFDGHYACFNLKDAGAAKPGDVLAAIGAHLNAGRRVLVHCWGGGGRTGLVLAAWLARSQGLAPAAAAAAVADYAKEARIPRRVDLAALEQFLAQAAA